MGAEKNIQNIQVIEWEDKTGVYGPYTIFQTNKGPLGSFLPETIRKLKDTKGASVRVELEQKGDYLNIVKFLNTVDAGPKITDIPIGENRLTPEEVAFVRKLREAFK